MPRIIKLRPTLLTTGLAVALFLLLAALATPASAGLLDWSLSGVIFGDRGGTVTGTITTDAATGGILRMYITVDIPGLCVGPVNFACPGDSHGFPWYGYPDPYQSTVPNAYAQTALGIDKWVRWPNYGDGNWYEDDQLFLVFSQGPVCPAGSTRPPFTTISLVSQCDAMSFYQRRFVHLDSLGNIVDGSEAIEWGYLVVTGDLVWMGPHMYPQGGGGEPGVPLPTSAFLLGSGLLSLALARRRKRRRT